MSRRVPVHATTSTMEADFIRIALVDHGIDCTVENQNAAMYAIGMPIPAAPLLLTVPEKQAEVARQLISAALRTMKLPRSNDSVPMQSLPCACGRMLEIPEGAVAQVIECPYCGRAVEIGGTGSPGAQPGPPAPRTERDLGIAFNSDLAFAEILSRLDALAPWRWRERDCAWYGNLASARPESPLGSTIKVDIMEAGTNEMGQTVVAGGGRRFCISLRFESTHPDASRECEALESRLRRDVLPALGAVDLLPTDSIDA